MIGRKTQTTPFEPSPRRRNFANEDGTDASEAPEGKLTTAGGGADSPALSALIRASPA